MKTQLQYHSPLFEHYVEALFNLVPAFDFRVLLFQSIKQFHNQGGVVIP